MIPVGWKKTTTATIPAATPRSFELCDTNTNTNTNTNSSEQ
ncbi:hypothetical protein L21SP2_0994 [Salinispira pacifica]|uniref:Uncharacterized protein n=1 Tax=Salinispira pacifica TaxID=1307761 RepID=V5WF34_9SPIO|nr:hypothetical protein L21SP2_0994 [Salinispira pacifica]